MNVWLIRIIWILGALVLIGEMFLLANPRHRVPDPSEWENYEANRFTIRKPQRLRARSVIAGRLFAGWLVGGMVRPE